MTDMRRAVWRKSTRSGDNGNCVEVATNLAAVAGIRDSKDPNGPVLVVSRDEFRQFLAGVAAPGAVTPDAA